MMERLKARPSQDPAEGELVTRADGTQAIRVRKRKRRSHQPKREEAKRLRRIRAIQIGSALVALIVLTLVIGGAYLYTNTAPFRNKLAATIEAELGASVQLREFRVTPVSANATALTMEWPEGGFPSQLELRAIAAKVSPATMFGRAFTGEEIVATHGRFILQRPLPGASQAIHPKKGTVPLRFARVAVNNLELALMDGATPLLRIIGGEGSLSAPPDRGWKTLDLHRGSFSFKNMPTLKLERGRMEVHPGEIRMLGLRLHDNVEPKGDLDFSGTINTLNPEARSVLTVKLTAFNVADLFGPELAKFIQVRLDSREVADSNFFAFSAANPADAELSVAFTNSERDPRAPRASGDSQDTDLRTSKPVNNFIVGFNFLDLLSKAADDSFYKHPAFEEITGIIGSKNGEITVSELECLRRSRFAIKGDFVIGKNKALSGTLQIGLPEGVLRFVEDQRFKAMFGPLIREFHWTTVRLSGTTDIPSDDFAKSYQEANPVAAPDDAAGAASDGERPAAPGESDRETDPGKAFEDLTRPAQ